MTGTKVLQFRKRSRAKGNVQDAIHAGIPGNGERNSRLGQELRSRGVLGKEVNEGSQPGFEPSSVGLEEKVPGAQPC